MSDKVEKELREKVHLLQKASKDEPPSTIIAMLKGLEKIPVTELMLRATNAGKIVGKLRSKDTQANPDIRDAASAVVSAWKTKVRDDKTKTASTRTSTPSNIASPAPPATPSSVHNNQPYTGNIEKRHFNTDKPNYKITDNTTRNNCIGMMYNGIAYQSTDSVEVVLAKAVEIEAAAFKNFKGASSDYAAKIRSLFQNLKVKSNQELRRRVRSGEITPMEFVKMSQDELKSQEAKKRDEALEKENFNNAQVAQPEKSISDALTCGKCGQKKVSYTQAQTRSADEPMTTFCECLNCGNRWKFS